MFGYTHTHIHEHTTHLSVKDETEGGANNPPHKSISTQLPDPSIFLHTHTNAHTHTHSRAHTHTYTHLSVEEETEGDTNNPAHKSVSTQLSDPSNL